MLSLLSFLALLSAGAAAACILAGAALAVRAAGRPRGPEPAAWPAVTCLKPVKGLDPGARENFEAFLALDYPAPLQFLFVVEAEADPAVGVLRELQARDPRVSLVVAGRALAGSQKLHNLARGAPQAAHPVLCVSDSDVRPRPDSLRVLVSELLAGAGPVAAPAAPPPRGAVAAVCAPVYHTGAANLAARAFQAFSNSDLAGVLAVQEAVGRTDTLIGGMYVVRRDALDAVGGYPALGPHICDDGALGMRLARRGYRVRAGGGPVAIHLPRATWREFLSGGHRWWLMARVSAPGRFALSLALMGPAYGTALFAARGWAGRLDAWTVAAGPGLALLHGLAAAWVGARCGPPGLDLRYVWLQPVVDWLEPGFWWAALLWPRIRWRGHCYLVRSNGLAERLEQPPERHSP
ncbi:MAG TPA: glycosyltransferase [Candidatus Saccharimonadales bacterium]|nr:glycosyltransferase [Candidatus Saccharimonadales bacterium]